METGVGPFDPAKMALDCISEMGIEADDTTRAFVEAVGRKVLSHDGPLLTKMESILRDVETAGISERATHSIAECVKEITGPRFMSDLRNFKEAVKTTYNMDTERCDRIAGDIVEKLGRKLDESPVVCDPQMIREAVQRICVGANVPFENQHGDDENDDGLGDKVRDDNQEDGHEQRREGQNERVVEEASPRFSHTSKAGE